MDYTSKVFAEAVYRLVSGEFAGCTIKKAANTLDCTEYRIRKTLSVLQQRHPSLFPLLTAIEHRVNTLRREGESTQDIAAIMNITDRRVQYIYRQLADKGHPPSRRPKILSYHSALDPYVKEKW